MLLPWCGWGAKKLLPKLLHFAWTCVIIYIEKEHRCRLLLINLVQEINRLMWKSGGYFFLFFSIFYYKIGKSDKYKYHRKKFIPRYVVHTTTSPRVSKGVKSFIRSLLLRLKGSNRHRLVLLPLYAAFSLYCNARKLSIPCCADGTATAFTFKPITLVSGAFPTQGKGDRASGGWGCFLKAN